MAKYLLALAMVLVTGVAFAYWRWCDAYANAVQRASIKATLRLEQLQRLDEIKSALERGCSDTALHLVQDDVDNELSSLKVIVVAKEDTGYQALKEMKAKNPAVLDRMKINETQKIVRQAIPLCARATPY